MAVFICFARMENSTTTTPQPPKPPLDPDLRWLENLATLMDNQFKIPLTSLRFGLDSLVGLVPYVGDLSGFIVSGILMRTMVKKGAGVGLILQMFGNIVLDALVGIIPFLGDLFDFGFKANRRNVALLKKYYASGQPRPNAKWSMAIVALLFMGLFVGLIWASWTVTAWLWSSLFF